MGTNSSSQKKKHDTSQYGQLYLETDKTAYHAGETVNGKIFLNLISHYPGNQLFLRIKGKEVVHLVKNEQRGKYSQDTHYSEKKDIIKEYTLVYSWDSLLPGQFTIPFSFWLPQTLPSSFYQQGPRYLAFIVYKLEAFLKPHQADIPKMKYKQTINFKQTITKTKNLSFTVTTPLKTWFCCKQGSNVLKAKFEKNYYSPGENAQVSMELDNSQSQLKNLEVAFSLKQKLDVKANGRALSFNFIKVKQELPGIPQDSNQKAASINITLPRAATESDFHEPVANKWDLISLKEKPYLITSNTRSSLITSEFFLEISCPMGGCYPTLPLVKLPIGILSPDFQLPAVSAPDNWEPETLNNVALAFPSEMHQSLLYEYNNGLMNEDQMSRHSKDQINTEMAQISMPNQKFYNTEYNQNYYKKL